MSDKINTKSFKRRIVSALALAAMFIMFTVTVKVFDVNETLAGNRTAVGFAELNKGFYDITAIFGHLNAWRILAQCLNAVAVGAAIAMVCLSAWQMIGGKSVKAMDKRLWMLLASYADLALIYGLFRILKINFGPAIVGETVLPSYVSAYCLNSFVIFSGLLPIIKVYITEAELGKLLLVAFRVLRVLAVLFCLISGAEWLTDIVGALLLGIAMLCLLNAGLEIIEASENE